MNVDSIVAVIGLITLAPSAALSLGTDASIVTADAEGEGQHWSGQIMVWDLD